MKPSNYWQMIGVLIGLTPMTPQSLVIKLNDLIIR
jgi:hypothetical protein